MENAVNSMNNLIKVNIEPSLVGNYLEGVTTRVEPKVKAMAIITHSIENNPIEKRSAPDNKGDEIVWSAWQHAELGRNDLTTFGEFNFNMARTAIGNKVIKMVSRFPVTVKQNVTANMVNVKALSKLGFSKSAKLAGVVISLASLRRLLTPILTLISLNIAFISPVVGTSANSSRTPYLTMFRTVFAVSFGAKVSKGFITIWTNLRDYAFIAGIILTRINPTAKLQKTFSAASLFSQRMSGHRLTADNTSLKGQFGYAITLFRAILSVASRKFLATYRTSSHIFMIPQLDSIVK